MKALATVVIACVVSTAIAIALLLRSPAAAWWVNPAALAVLAGTVGVLVAIMAPRRWWRS